MPSQALQRLLEGAAEIDTLQSANPTPTGAPPHAPQLTRVIGRASVVLLSSHFERYHYDVFEELVQGLNAAGPPAASLPEMLRLRHSRSIVDELAQTEWTLRATKLVQFVRTEATLWSDDSNVTTLDHTRLLESMTAPAPEQLVKVYRLLAINNIFEALTRKPHTKADLWLQIKSLVDRRNSIAHGDAAVEATQQDVRHYRRSVEKFCISADRLIARTSRRNFGIELDWY